MQDSNVSVVHYQVNVHLINECKLGTVSSDREWFHSRIAVGKE